jgi:hypothetical protein
MKPDALPSTISETTIKKNMSVVDENRGVVSRNKNDSGSK